MTAPRLRAAAVLVTAIATLVATAAFAWAATSAPVQPSSLVRPTATSHVTHTTSKQRGEAQAAAVGSTCSYRGTEIACHNPSLGWWNDTDDCYWNLITPQPPAGDPLWLNFTPADGDLYQTTCEEAGGLGIGVLGLGVAFSSDPPPGYNGVVGLLNYLLALQAVVSLPILGPAIHTAPAAGGKGLVGLPVWMWSDASPLTLGPLNLNLGLVSAHALGQRIDWYMGDGHDVVCTTVGTPFTGAAGQYASPSCGYVYNQPSTAQPGGHYTITAAVTWSIGWTLGLDSGSLSIVRSSTSQLTINELQVVNQ